MDNINILGKDALYQGRLHQYISHPLIQVGSILQGHHYVPTPTVCTG